MFRNITELLLLFISIVIVNVFLLSVAECQMHAVTPDGCYVAVLVDKSTDRTGSALVIQSTIGNWKKEMPKGGNPGFTNDSKKICYTSRDSTLFILTLGTDQQTLIGKVTNYKLSNEWLLYKLQQARNLILRNLNSGEERRFEDVDQYSLTRRGNALLLKKGLNQGNQTSLQWVSLPQGIATEIWSDTSAVITTYSVDTTETHLAFVVQTVVNGHIQKTAIWYYKAGAANASLLVDDSSLGVPGFIIADNYVGFSKKSGKIFFEMQEKELPKADARWGKYQVWSYLDTKPQSQQIDDLFPRRYLAVVSVTSRKVLRLEQENEIVLLDENRQLVATEDIAVVCRFNGDVLTYDANQNVVDTYSMNEYNWNKVTQSSVYLISTNDGSRILVKGDIKPTSSTFPYFRFSPEGKFLVYYDQIEKNYFGYEINSKKTRGLTRDAATSWVKEDTEEAPRQYHRPAGVFGWIKNDVAVLLNDKYGDIWRVELSANGRPVSITNEFARSLDGVFFTPLGLSLFSRGQHVFRDDEKIVVGVGLDDGIRVNGFYSVAMDSPSEPEPLIKVGGKYNYEFNIRSDKSVMNVLTRQSTEEPPTVVYTRDFRTFTPVTNNQQEHRKGVKQKLITWKTPDGSATQGILYFPENFDPKKKYPVVLSYYERSRRSKYNMFQHVGEGLYSDHGYLHFIPDILYKLGETGMSVVNSVVSAAEFLAKLPYVDGKRIGITGISFGGYETNYLVTHSNIFAAAISECGVSNFFSYYGTEEKDNQGYSYMAGSETGQNRLGATPWERADLYFKNSAVFEAHKVTTPLLLIHGRKDYRVPYSQSIELFTALRRLGKPVWLISHPDGHTVVSDREFVEKFRQQFFDHYLKGEPAPLWMTRGVPARDLYQGDAFFQPDTILKSPPSGGLLMEEERTPQMQLLTKAKKSK